MALEELEELWPGMATVIIGAAALGFYFHMRHEAVTDRPRRAALEQHCKEEFANQPHVVATTQTSDGQIFDWIPLSPDVTAFEIPSPPPAPPQCPEARRAEVSHVSCEVAD